MLTAPAIAEPNRRRRTLLILGGLVVVLAAILAYNDWSARRLNATPITRTPFDFVVNWRCLSCGQAWEEAAAVGPRACRKCSRPEAYASIDYACGRHGTFHVAFQYDDSGAPLKIRIGSSDWIPPGDEDGNWNTRCPKCSAYMIPVSAPRPVDSGKAP
jgi:hypothetical protein